MKIFARATAVALSIFVAHHVSANASNDLHNLRREHFRDIIAFGDSLTDVGNVAGVTTSGFAPVINGYYQRERFSDGPVWVEDLADFLGFPARTPGRGSSTTLPPQPHGNTWAWGGAEAADGFDQPPGVVEPIPNLITAVDEYLLSNRPNRRNLFAIWAGADNLLIGNDFSPLAAQEAVDAVVTSIRKLARRGAHEFLVFNMPSLGDTPFVQFLNSNVEPGIAFLANIYSISFNQALNDAVRGLARELRHSDIHVIDVYSELALIVNTVNAGLTYTPSFFVPGDAVAIDNVTGQGLDYFNLHGTFPPNYLFWDGVHPTGPGHQIVAGLALQVIEEED
jgi:phospholipase/lecithinase/hemolysin